MSEIPDRNKKRMSEVPSAFFSSPAAGGIVLIIASAAAIIVANSPLREGHCCKVSDEAAFCLIQRPYISKTLLTRRISPRGSP